MKELIGLLVFLGISSTTIYFLITKKLEAKYGTLLLIFSIVSGFTIANYDLIHKLKFGELELETAKKEIITIKDSAIKEINEEIETQKESIKFLITNANDTRDKLESQNKSLLDVIEIAKKLQLKIEQQKNNILELNRVSSNTKKDIEKLNQASAQIALSVIRATYFTLATKNEFGGPRSKKAVEEILKDINIILPSIIPDENKRRVWINELETTLPEKK